MDFEVRSFRATDPDEVLRSVQLLQSSLPGEQIDQIQFAQRVLNDPNLSPGGTLVAESNGAIIGFIHAVHRTTPIDAGFLTDPDIGYISLLAVDESRRRQGIASRLLDQACSWLKSVEAKKIIVGPYSPGYFAPGVDKSYLPAQAFFAANQFASSGEPLAMKVEAPEFLVPDWLDQIDFDGQSIEIAPWRPELTTALLEFARVQFAPDWARFVRDAVDDIAGGGDPNRLIVAWDSAANEIAGFSHYNGERFGPIGVDPRYRGRSIGQQLCRMTLEAQWSAGQQRAWFLWSNQATADRLYNGFGFKVWREFVTYTKEISDAG
jgi:GNAT superfamily N-acetyltransferase